MKKSMFTPDEVAGLINSGKKLILAGDENALKKLPNGHWIAGTIPYFMADTGGKQTGDEIFVNELPSYVKHVEIQTYSEEHIGNVYKDAPSHGFSVIIIPATSKVHLKFALKAPSFENFATAPLIGWISGVHLNDLGKVTPKVFLGDKTKVYEDRAVVMHITLPENKYADINIINIFEQGGGDKIFFEEDGFSAKEAIINGKKVNFAEYLLNNNLDTRLPLVANYSGAMINTSFQAVDKDNKIVSFYAPVFHGMEYRHAKAVKDYVAEFTGHLPHDGIDRIFFSCNCILNYLYSELEGKQTAGITGPITFGEIAYQLLNQTMAYVNINDF